MPNVQTINIKETLENLNHLFQCPISRSPKEDLKLEEAHVQELLDIFIELSDGDLALLDEATQLQTNPKDGSTIYQFPTLDNVYLNLAITEEIENREANIQYEKKEAKAIAK